MTGNDSHAALAVLRKRSPTASTGVVGASGSSHCVSAAMRNSASAAIGPANAAEADGNAATGCTAEFIGWIGVPDGLRSTLRKPVPCGLTPSQINMDAA